MNSTTGEEQLPGTGASIAALTYRTFGSIVNTLTELLLGTYNNHAKHLSAEHEWYWCPQPHPLDFQLVRVRSDVRHWATLSTAYAKEVHYYTMFLAAVRKDMDSVCPSLADASAGLAALRADEVRYTERRAYYEVKQGEARRKMLDARKRLVELEAEVEGVPTRMIDLLRRNRPSAADTNQPTLSSRIGKLVKSM